MSEPLLPNKPGLAELADRPHSAADDPATEHGEKKRDWQLAIITVVSTLVIALASSWAAVYVATTASRDSLQQSQSDAKRSSDEFRRDQRLASYSDFLAVSDDTYKLILAGLLARTTSKTLPD